MRGKIVFGKFKHVRMLIIFCLLDAENSFRRLKSIKREQFFEASI